MTDVLADVRKPGTDSAAVPKALALYRDWFNRRGFEPDWRLYFIRCEKFVKIGISMGHEIRAREIQAMNPFPVWTIGTIRGDKVLERDLHKLLYWVRHRGEWFRLTPSIVGGVSVRNLHPEAVI